MGAARVLDNDGGFGMGSGTVLFVLTPHQWAFHSGATITADELLCDRSVYAQ